MTIIDSFAPIKYAYIDPGTGSMLLTILIGLISVLSYGFKSLINKVSLFSTNSSQNQEKLDYVIYTDSKRYWNVFEPVCEEFERNKTILHYLTQSDDDPVFNKNYQYIKPEFIGDGNKGFSKLNNLNADILLSTTPSLDVYQWKKSKNVKYYIHIPHMCTDITYYRMYGIDYYDAILVTGKYQEEQIRKLEELRKLPAKDIKIVGLTYFDELKKRLDSSKRITNEIPVVLLAPSWGPSSILNLYGSTFIDELIKTGYEIVIRPHPQSFVSEKDTIEKLIKQYPNIEWNRDNDNFEILNKADIMVSDFSGVIFDYSLVFNKPIIFTNYGFDDSIYDAHWLDEQTWTFKTLPKIGEEINKDNFHNLKTIIDKCLNDDKYEQGRKEAIKESWYNIGNSARDIFLYMREKHKEVSGS